MRVPPDCYTVAMRRLSDWRHDSNEPNDQAAATRESPWPSGDLLILLLAVCTVLLGMVLTTASQPAADLQDADEPTDTPHRLMTEAAVTLITPLHPSAPHELALPGLTMADAAHAAIPSQPEWTVQPSVLFPDDADWDALDPDIAVITDAHTLRFRLRSDALFTSARAKLTPAGLAMLRPVVAILQRHHAPIAIAGHADSVPIHNQHYPSNWELSASRAASVLRYLADNGIAPERLHARGYAHTRPLAENDTALGRATNRRIEIIVTLPPQLTQADAASPTPKRLIMQTSTATTATASARHDFRAL